MGECDKMIDLGMESAVTIECIDKALVAYVECALWSSTDDDGRPLDDTYDESDLADETREQMGEDVFGFLSSCWEEGYDLARIEPEQIGHDLWLTRNGHGVGFWDRGLGKLGDDLTALARPYGECCLYVGDDGKVYAL
jgi:hypothetical protein